MATEPGLPDRVRQVLKEDFEALQPVPRVMRWITQLIPAHTGFRLRNMLLRLTGWDIGRSSVFASVPVWSGVGPIRSRLQIGADCFINVGCHFELNDRVVIGDGVAIGHDVLIMTTTHKIGPAERRAGDATTKAVEIGSGAWIGARSVLQPGVKIGEGAIVSSGSVVNADVPAHSVVAGAPATVVVPRLAGARSAKSDRAGLAEGR